jgi:hypothetical protein
LYGGFEDDEFTSIEIVQNNFIACGINRSAGDTAGDVYFVKLNPNGDSIKTQVIQKPKKDVCNGILKINNNTFHCVGGSIELPRTIMSNMQLGIDSNLNTITTHNNFNTYLTSFTFYTESTILPDNRIASTGSSNQAFFNLEGVSHVKDLNGNNILFTFFGNTTKPEEGRSICANFEDSSITICGYTEGYGAVQKDVFIVKCNKLGLPSLNAFPLKTRNAIGHTNHFYSLSKWNESYLLTNHSENEIILIISELSGKTLQKLVIKSKEVFNIHNFNQKILILQMMSTSDIRQQKIIFD